MPIHDRAYLRMEDRGVRSRRPAFLAIARYGAKVTRRGRLFWFFVVGAWAPALVWAFLIYTAGESGGIPPILVTARLAVMPEAEYRGFVSQYVLVFLQLQAFALTCVAAVSGGPAIAEDTRRHAFELYFSRPITAIEYILGKWFQVFNRLLLVLLYPLLFVFVFAFGFLPGCFRACWPVALSASLAAMFMAACWALVVLGVSSSVRSTRYAVVFWFILVFCTMVGSLVLVQLTKETRFEAVSLRFAIEHLASRIIGADLAAVPPADPSERSTALCGGVAGFWLAGALALLVRRVRADARS